MRLVIPIVLGSAAIVSLTLVAATTQRTATSSVVAVTTAAITPDGDGLSTPEANAGFIGLSPEAMAVAGIDAAGAQTIIERIHGQEAVFDQARLLLEDVQAANAEITFTREQLQKGTLDETIATRYAMATSAREDAVSLAQSRLDIAYAATLDGFDQAVLDRLAAWRSSQGRRVPAHFRCVERSDSEWKALELALIAEGRSERTGEPLAARHVDTLSLARADAEVVAAEQRLDQSLGGIRTAFDAYD